MGGAATASAKSVELFRGREQPVLVGAQQLAGTLLGAGGWLCQAWEGSFLRKERAAACLDAHAAGAAKGLGTRPACQ